METSFIFPLEEGMSVSKLTAEFGNDKIETIIDEREKVSALVKNAITEGKTVIEGTYATKES